MTVQVIKFGFERETSNETKINAKQVTINDKRETIKEKQETMSK